jgi:hypothetical protein
MEIEIMKRLVSVLTAAAAAAAIAGCGTHPFIPAAATAYTQHAKATKLSAPLLGVDVYSETAYSAAQAIVYGTPVLSYLKTHLKAQVAGLMWDLCTANFQSETVTACKSNATTDTGTMSPGAILALAKQAKADGLQVAMRPIIRVGSPTGWSNPNKSWEGHLDPSSVYKFLTSLLKAELPYLKIAKQVHAEQFVLTTELQNVRYSPAWLAFLSKAQKDCGCQVSYSAYESQYLRNSATLAPTKALGVDFYPAFSLPSSASQARVTAAWENALSGVSESRLERTSLDEVSIRGTAGAYKHPYAWNDNGKAAPKVQARYFTAACATAAHYHMRALFFYFVPLNDYIVNPLPFPAYFVKNAGSKAIAGCPPVLAKGAVK